MRLASGIGKRRSARRLGDANPALVAHVGLDCERADDNFRGSGLVDIRKKTLLSFCFAERVAIDAPSTVPTASNLFRSDGCQPKVAVLFFRRHRHVIAA
jgi:hypothetical protein